MKIQPLGRPTLPDGIVDQIRTQILLGTLAPGAEIPSERELASGFGVNRTTVREAMMELTRLRLIERRQGRRCVVLDFRQTGSIELLVHMLRLPAGSAVRDEAAESFFDTLRRVYLTAVDLIAERDDGLEALRARVHEIEAAIEAEDEVAVLAADRGFHTTLFQATRSLVFELLFASLYRAIDDGLDLGGSYGRRAAAEYVRRKARGPGLPHRAILDALEQGDMLAAGEIIERTVAVMRDVFERGTR